MLFDYFVSFLFLCFHRLDLGPNDIFWCSQTEVSSSGVFVDS